jgi:hypothetical protein
MIKLSRVSLVLTALAFSSSAAFAASVFNFDSDTLGKGTAFTDTNNGISATFSSSGDPNGFLVIQPAAYGVVFQTLTGNVLTDALGSSNLTLTILFGSGISSLNLDFAVIAGVPTPFTLQALRNGASLGSVTETDSVPAGFAFAEGVATFSSSNFNEVILGSTAQAFAVDNITVTPATVTATPEPGTMPLLLAALMLAPLGLPRLRRRFSLT